MLRWPCPGGALCSCSNFFSRSCLSCSFTRSRRLVLVRADVVEAGRLALGFLAHGLVGLGLHADLAASTGPRSRSRRRPCGPACRRPAPRKPRFFSSSRSSVAMSSGGRISRISSVRRDLVAGLEVAGIAIPSR